MALAQDEKPVGQQPIDFEALGLEPVGEEELFGGKIETAVAEAPEPAPTSTGELDYAALGLEPIAEKEMFGFEMPKKEPQKTSDWDTLRGLEVSMRQFPQLAYGVAGLVGATSEQITGYGEALRDWGFRGYKDWEQSIEPVAKETDDVTVAWQRAKEGDVGALVDWAQYGIGYALGQLGETAAVSALGALAGGAAAAPAGPAAVPAAAGGAVLAAAGKTGFKALATNLVEKAIAKQALKIAEEQATKQGVKLTAEQLAKQAESQAVKKLAGKEIGSNAAIFANSIGMELGGIYGEAESQAKAEGRKLTGVDLARIWGTGLAAGGLEGLTDKIGLDLLKGKLSAKLPAGRLAGAAVAGGIGILGEGLTETAQTALERAGAGKDVISDDAVNEYINAASLGALGGGVIGGAGGFISGNPKENAAAKAKISAEVSKTIAPETANEVAKQADAVIQEVAQETPDQRVARLQQEAKAAAGITLEEEAATLPAKPEVAPTRNLADLEVRPPTDNVQQVAAANDLTVGRADVNIPAQELESTVNLSDPKERERVDNLKDQISSEGGFISRVIVDGQNNVVEGQHRVQAMKELGYDQIPAVQLKSAEDFIPDSNALDKVMQDAGLTASDNRTQMRQLIAEIISDEKGDVTQLREYEAPAGFETAWNAATEEVIRQNAAPEAAPAAVEPTPVTPPVTPQLEPLRRVARAEQTEEDVAGLVDSGFVEVYNGQPVITQAGLDALPEAERPRLTPEARKIQIDTRTSEAAAEAISKNLRIGVDQVPVDVRMPAGWTLEGDVYVPPTVETAPAPATLEPKIEADLRSQVVSGFEARSKQHKEFSEGLNKAVAANSLTEDGAILLREVFKDADPKLLGRATISINSRRRYLGFAFYRGGTELSDRAIKKALDGRFGKNMTPEVMAMVVTHEIGHHGYNSLLTKDERSLIKSIFTKMGEKGRRDFFSRGAIPKPFQVKYHAKSQQEFFAQSFAEYVFSDRLPDPEIKPIFDRIIQKLKQAFQTLMNRNANIEQLVPLYEKLLGAAPTPEVREARREPAITPQQDRDYLDAVERGDYKTAQRILDSGFPPLPEMSQGLKEEMGYWLNASNESGNVMPSWLALKDLMGSWGDRDSVASSFKKELQDIGIKLGYYQTISLEDAKLRASQGLNLGKGYDFKRGDKYYIGDGETPLNIQPTETRDEGGNIIPLSQRFQPEQADIRYARREQQLANSLDSGDFVSAQALVDGGATMDRATFLRSITPSATQRATTIHTRLERDGIISKDEFANEQGLVYGDGRGAASAYLGAESYEPFPPAGFAPDYSGDRVAGQGTSIDKKFRTILNTFVLNVVDPQTRSFIVKDIANLLENGGRAVFVTRGKDVANSKALVSFGPLERIQRSEGKLTYQKGFTQPELIQYLQETLGDGFEVRALRGGSPSDVRVEVVKNTDATLDNPPIVPEARERRRVQMGRAGMETSAVEARLQELGFPTGGIIRVVNQPDADFEGRTIILDGKVTGIELNASALKDNAAIDRVLNHEFAESANADGALSKLVERLTPKEKKEINDTITRLRYEERARTSEEAARAIETLAEAWKGRGFFTRAVARVEAWASKLGFKLTRRAAEYIAARNLADINSGFKVAYNQSINVTTELGKEVRASRSEPQAIPTFTEGTPEAATLKEMATSMAKVDAASEAKGGKPETYKISEIASVWMDSGLGERELQDAIVEYTNLTPANAKRVASAIARQYDIQQSIATAFLETQTGLSVEALPEGVTLPKEVDPDRPKPVMQRLFEVFMGVKVPPKKITGSEKAFLRSQILLKIAANRAAKNAQKATADAVVETIKSMGLYGEVRPKQVAALTKRAAKVIWTSEKSVEVFNDYAAKVVANANYDADLREAKDAQKRAKQLSKQKNVAMSPQRQVLDNISRVAVNRLDDPRMFADVVNYYMRAFKSAVSPDYVVMPDSELTSYLSQMESEATTNQTEIDRVANERLAAKYGVSVDEVNKLVEADNIIAELKKIEKREEMENLLTEKAIETQLGLSGYDTSLLRADQKPLVEALLKVDPSKLDAKEKQKLIRIANNVIYNDQTNGAQVFVAIANGQQNARQAAQDSAMVKKNRAWIDILPTLGSKTAEKTFRNWALELQSVADTFRNIFGKESMAKMFRLMGLYDLDRGFTDSNNVLDKIQEAMAEFYKKNVKKYGKAARDQDGILSEGIVGFLIQRVPAKGESESIAQRRDLIKQDIANRRDSQEADRITMADRIEKILNEIDGNTIEEILNNLKQKYRPNYDSVMYLMNDLLPQYKEFLQRFDENFNDQANNYDNPYYLPIDFINAGPTLEITPESEALFYENVSLRPKQAANTIKRVDYTKLPLDKSNKPKEIQFNLRKGTYDSLSEQINAAYTSEAWQKIFSFMKTPEAQIALGGGANRDFMVERLNRLRISRMRRGSMNNGAMAKFADSLSTISRKLGVGIALGGVYQVFKQSPDQLISAIGTTGRPDLLSESITTIGKAKSILNKFSIGRRGDASAGYKYINQMEGAQNRLERAFTESRWSEVKENASKVADVWMVALKKTDFACAAAAWMTYYRADLDKKGIKFEGWDREAQLVDTDPTRQDAASYAENMTDIYQGSSDPTKMATFAQSGKSGWENLFKAIFVPFNSFAVQQRMRIYSDARDAFTQSGEAGKAGAAGLTATVGGMLAFHTVRRLMLPVLTGAGATALYALLGVDMDEPDEEKQKEEANKLWRQFQGEVIANMLVGGAPQFVEAQLIDAVNYSNYLVSLQLESDDVIDDKGEIMSFDKYQKERSPLWRYRSFDNAMTLGMLDIGLGQAEKAAMQTKMLATPEEMEKYTPEEQRLLWFSALSEWMYLMRLNDADFARMVTKARKDMIAAVEDREKRIRAIREGR